MVVLRKFGPSACLRPEELFDAVISLQPILQIILATTHDPEGMRKYKYLKSYKIQIYWRYDQIGSAKALVLLLSSAS